jgi:aspartyl/asparaginyl-tRNA synthetase
MNYRVYIKNLSKKKNEIVSINDWIDSRRDQGKMIFLNDVLHN